ncbi:metal ABC transporter ATP-binding protein [Saccharopolyspora rectivirgula]|uniref:ABC transporter n=1 Tax=Saccharopolyspora rectivirgula TaxID=28042 RepID=A0A073B5Q7_9PSEU|nr:metal ABC transporter ATP-binding protein [Saccharopolyspora rectivirgula]KEI42954.1 ABC transporter [Saccharopolyspora rectivirgula]
MSAITARNITVHYGDTLALDDVSATVDEARICALLGMNGSGKSTLFKTLLGLLKPDRGTVQLLGRDQRTARREGLVAYVPQTEAVDWSFPVTVADVVSMGRYGHLGITRRLRAADRRAVADALERVGLTELATRPIGALSGGQRKRAFIARAIAQQARLMFLDEPFAGVDRRSEAVITAQLQQLRAEGRTILISTHDLASVPELCDEAILLQQRVIAAGPVEEVVVPETLARTFGINDEVETG